MPIQRPWQLAAVVCTASIGAACAPGLAAQTAAAYFSFEGEFANQGDQHRFEFDLSRALDAADAYDFVTQFRTFAYSGGTNLAGDAVAAGGIDSVLTLTDSAGTRQGFNDDAFLDPVYDSLLSWDGVAPFPRVGSMPLTDPLPAGAYGLDLSAFSNLSGRWALDIVAPADAFTMTASTPTFDGVSNPGPLSTSLVQSLKFGTVIPFGGNVPGTALFHASDGLVVARELVVAHTGNAVYANLAGETFIGGETRVLAGGVLKLEGGNLVADGGLKIDGGEFVQTQGSFSLGLNRGLEVSNGGAARFRSNSATIGPGEFYGVDQGYLEVPGGAGPVSVPGILDIAAGGLLFVINDSSVRVDILRFSGGTVLNPGPGATVTINSIEGLTTLSLGGGLALGSTAAGPTAAELAIGNGQAIATGGPLSIGVDKPATVTVIDGGRLTATGATSLVGDDAEDGTFGDVVVTGAGSRWNFLDGGVRIRRGTVGVGDGGVIAVSGAGLAAIGPHGILRGNGNFIAANGLGNRGQVILDSDLVGAALTHLTIVGDYLQEDTGALEVGVASGAPEKLVIAPGAAPATVRLGGTLRFAASDPPAAFEVIPLYAAAAEIIDGDARTTVEGVFARVTGHVLGDGTALAVLYGPGTSDVVVQRARYGDVTLDGEVDQADLDSVIEHLDDTASDGASWTSGELDGDGTVGLSDIDAVVANWTGAVLPDLDTLTRMDERQVPALPPPWLLMLAICLGALRHAVIPHAGRR